MSIGWLIGAGMPDRTASGTGVVGRDDVALGVTACLGVCIGVDDGGVASGSGCNPWIIGTGTGV